MFIFLHTLLSTMLSDKMAELINSPFKGLLVTCYLSVSIAGVYIILGINGGGPFDQVSKLLVGAITPILWLLELQDTMGTLKTVVALLIALYMVLPVSWTSRGSF
jgi:hypothetical protein